MRYAAILADPSWRFADVRTLILAPRREPSRKPDEIYARIERLVPGYLELFARRRVGWDALGDEVDSRPCGLPWPSDGGPPPYTTGAAP